MDDDTDDGRGDTFDPEPSLFSAVNYAHPFPDFDAEGAFRVDAAVRELARDAVAREVEAL